jgi:NAD(P)-dependent dehydrogenase (short-subunit alcohol dehydrogenase family)
LSGAVRLAKLLHKLSKRSGACGKQGLVVFLTGASGYIGGSVAQRLIELGHEVSGLARSEQKAQQIRQLRIQPVIGTLGDAAVLAEAAYLADAVIHAANSDDRASVETFVLMFTEAIAEEMRNSGVRVMVACPGPTATQFFDQAPTTMKASQMKNGLRGLAKAESVAKRSGITWGNSENTPQGNKDF